jgi:hypothetical protein
MVINFDRWCRGFHCSYVNTNIDKPQQEMQYISEAIQFVRATLLIWVSKWELLVVVW